MIKNKLFLGVGTVLVPLISGGVVVSCGSGVSAHAIKDFLILKNENVFDSVDYWQKQEIEKYTAAVGKPGYTRVDIKVKMGEIINTKTNETFKEGSVFTVMTNGIAEGNFVAPINGEIIATLYVG